MKGQGADGAVEAGRPGPVPGPIGLAASRAYGAAVARRNRRFDAGRGVVRFDRAVISIGNLSVGGTGKTPMVAHVISLLVAAGRRPCIAMRGYGSVRRRDGLSDEAALYRERFPAVPVVAQPARAEGLMRLFGTPEGEAVDTVVLDDGFQHRRIARDLDVVLIDTTQQFPGRLLPAGWMREPASSLRRADWALVTHAEAVPAHRVLELKRAIGAAAPEARLAATRHEWDGLTVHEGGADRAEPLTWLRDRPLLAVCAIGNPGAFLAAARDSGADVAPMVLRDHDPYAPRTMRRVAAAGKERGTILTTEKDWTKLSAAGVAWACPVARPRLTVRFCEQAVEFENAVLGARAEP